MASSPQQPLNEQGVQRISGYKFKNKKQTHNGIRLGTWNIGSFCGRGTEATEGLRKRKVDICGLQKGTMEEPRSSFYWC